ncbi:MAG: sulfatase-like hydrolase/transferase [Verrucomicrobiales bacterium]|nr:sulfatase-like hydrolase/transferase [Verrucomicrobiales bacterium]
MVDADGEPEHHSLNSWYRTPNMERLAAQGIRFSDFYAHTVCSPTRISIMTGQNSARHRTTQFISPNGKNTGDHGPEAWNWKGLTREDVTLPALLREAGYRTVHVGKAHFAPPDHEGENPTSLGFDVNIAGCSYGQPGSYFGNDGYGNLNPKRQQRAVPGLEEYHHTDTFLTEALTIEAIAEIDRSIEQKRPFYLYMSHYAVHSPFQSDPRFANHYAASEKAKAPKAFATLIEGIDKSLGDLMNHLQDRKVARETLILFLGDNGTACPLGSGDEIAASAPLRGRKASRWEGGTRVPFIAAWGNPTLGHPIQERLPISAGSIQTQMGLCYDIFPTLTALAGAEIPAGHIIDGHSLKALFSGERDGARKEVFLSHFPHSHTNNYFTTYREGDWKLIYQYFPDTAKGETRHALYNLKSDPSESNDVSADHPDLIKSLSQAMIQSLRDMKALYPTIEGDEHRPLAPQL